MVKKTGIDAQVLLEPIYIQRQLRVYDVASTSLPNAIPQQQLVAVTNACCNSATRKQ